MQESGFQSESLGCQSDTEESHSHDRSFRCRQSPSSPAEYAIHDIPNKLHPRAAARQLHTLLPPGATSAPREPPPFLDLTPFSSPDLDAQNWVSLQPVMALEDSAHAGTSASALCGSSESDCSSHIPSLPSGVSVPPSLFSETGASNQVYWGRGKRGGGRGGSRERNSSTGV